jgi:eukaryotic-like serine/threonine-protein kinase
MSRSTDADPGADTLADPHPFTGGEGHDFGPNVATQGPPGAATLPLMRGRFEAAKSSSTTGQVAVEAAPLPSQAEGFELRYEARGLLGAGGMGEVRLCKDRRVGREVALKVMRPHTAGSPDSQERFVREARVQGQLEHPALVPVYDLGVTPQGEAYFTMKRVRGRTLQEIVQLLTAGDRDAVEKYTRRRLLTALHSVCLAVDFAHRRGVLHRDLKPANIILGDFGEVYVLDWGLAKVAGEADPAVEPLDEPVAGPGGRTLQGAILGTPGYMAPEQVRGENERLDGRADVYALGAILFEAVALERLHDGPSMPEVLGSTLFGADARASARGRLDVPPELEAICVRATALDPKDRYPSARALADDLERLLDGDRHEALRRDLATRHVEAARAALGRAAGGGGEARALRAEALREAATALALEPNHAEALATMARLLVEVPDEVPREAQAGLDEAAEAERRDTARLIARRLVLWSAFLPLAFWMGVRSHAASLTAVVAVVACSAASWALSRREGAGPRQTLALLAISSVAAALAGGLFGPFILVPGLVATNTMLFTMSAERPARLFTLLAGVLAMLVPFALELLGLVPPSYAFHEGVMRVLPRAAEFPALPTIVCLILTSVSMVIIPGLVVSQLRDRLQAAERRLYLQAWNLSQLVPSAARQGFTKAAP